MLIKINLSLFGSSNFYGGTWCGGGLGFLIEDKFLENDNGDRVLHYPVTKLSYEHCEYTETVEDEIRDSLSDLFNKKFKTDYEFYRAIEIRPGYYSGLSIFINSDRFEDYLFYKYNATAAQKIYYLRDIENRIIKWNKRIAKMVEINDILDTYYMEYLE